MLAKITRGNQITIPRELIKKLQVSALSPYFEVGYVHGVIYLKPVTVEDRIAPEQFDKFQKWALEKEPGDSSFTSLDDGIQDLKKRMK